MVLGGIHRAYLHPSTIARPPSTVGTAKTDRSTENIPALRCCCCRLGTFLVFRHQTVVGTGTKQQCNSAQQRNDDKREIYSMAKAIYFILYIGALVLDTLPLCNGDDTAQNRHRFLQGLALRFVAGARHAGWGAGAGEEIKFQNQFDINFPPCRTFLWDTTFYFSGWEGNSPRFDANYTF